MALTIHAESTAAHCTSAPASSRSVFPSLHVRDVAADGCLAPMPSSRHGLYTHAIPRASLLSIADDFLDAEEAYLHRRLRTYMRLLMTPSASESSTHIQRFVARTCDEFVSTFGIPDDWNVTELRSVRFYSHCVVFLLT